MVLASICAASDSTWLKSGLTVASAVKAEVGEYLRPSDGSPSRSPSWKLPSSRRAPSWRAVKAGSSSRPSPGRTSRMPASEPHWQAQHDSSRSTAAHMYCSRDARGRLRQTFTRQSCSDRLGKRRLANGIASSACQPPPVTRPALR